MAQSLPSTPKAASAPAPQPDESRTPGKWRHPQMNEIVRRQNAGTFGDRNIKKLVWNGGALFATWVFGNSFKSYSLRLQKSSKVATYPDVTLLILQLIFVMNIVIALYPLFRPKDDLSDIPLTPTQRSLLGLDPSVTPPVTPGTTYITPPKYRLSASRTASPASKTGSPLSRSASASGHRLSSGGSFSPSSSPLFHKAIANGGRDSGRRPSFGSSSLFDRSSPFRESSIGPATPSPMGGKRFWELPETTEDVFSLFTPADIRRTRDHALSNFETLLLSITSRLTVLKNHPSFPDPELAPDRDALNCIRILTRILPFVYEAEHLEEWEEKFFWARRKRKTREAQVATEVLFDEAQAEGRDRASPRASDYEDVKPLAEELIDTLLDLLFFTDFTIPKLSTATSKVSYSIWQSGVGCNTSMGSNKELENNRCEVLRLLLTLTGKAMYMPSSLLPVQGVKAITYIATCPDKQAVLTLLCSLLNTAVKYNPASWRVPYDHVVWKDPKQILVIYCLQFLLVLLLYPVPEDGRGSPPKNYYRHYFGRLHRPQDFQFLVDGMTRILNQPMQATNSYLPGSQKTVKWAPEMLILFWEALQCNKRFRSFIIDSNRSHDFVILCIFYAIEYKSDPSKHGLVRMCIFILQTMSVEPNFGKSLNMEFEAQDTLPQSIRIPGFKGSYADYLIMSIHTLITSSKGTLTAVYPALLAILNNIAAYVEHISPAACSKILQLFTSMSAPSFLLANESNHLLLAAVLDSVNSILEHKFTENPFLVYVILKYRKRFEAVREFTLESGQQEIERQNERRKAEGNPQEFASSPVLSPSEEDPHVSSGARSPLRRIPEENSPFSIGGDDSEDEREEEQKAPSQASQSVQSSRRPSMSSMVDESVPLQLRGMSEKARGKMPAGQPSFSRQNSMTSQSSMSAALLTSPSGFTPTVAWLESWLPELPLHTILTIISAITPHVPDSAFQSASSPEARTLIANLPTFTEDPAIHNVISEPAAPRVHSFEWSALSMGWYESLLWGFIFSSEMVVGSASGATPGTVGVWNGTVVKLFKVQEAAAQGPTLLAPKGAVDAVGSNLVQRIGNLSLRRTSTQESQGSSRPASIREV
ncbi:high-temperature-induced dauer-formation protein-domain-containing protein [Aspergillus floccosus]